MVKFSVFVLSVFTLCVGCFDTIETDVYRSCLDILHHNPESSDGVYQIAPDGSICIFDVYCDMTTDGGGWMVFQRRTDGSQNFERDWDEYRSGFGDLENEFWLGNENLSTISRYLPDLTLRFDMTYQNAPYYAEFENIFIGDEASGYRIVCSANGFSGSAGDAFSGQHCGRKFSTQDRDNDDHSSHCAQVYTGAWWYGSCHHSNLNGQFGVNSDNGPRWNKLTGNNAVQSSEIKLREGFVYQKFSEPAIPIPTAVLQFSELIDSQTETIIPKMDEIEVRMADIEDTMNGISEMLATLQPDNFPAVCLSDNTLQASYFTSLEGPCGSQVSACLGNESCALALDAHSGCKIPQHLLSDLDVCWINVGLQPGSNQDDTEMDSYELWEAFSACVDLVCSCVSEPGKWEFTTFLSALPGTDPQQCCVACSRTAGCAQWQFGENLCVLLEETENLAVLPSDIWVRGSVPNNDMMDDGLMVEV